MLYKYCLVSCLLLILFIDTIFAGWSSQKCKQYKPKVPKYEMYKHKRVSERKCMEYMYELAERKNIRKYKCGNSNGFHIIRGNLTKPSEYPHMGALGWATTEGSYVFLCGSSLISERFVLTSAHCTHTTRYQTIRPRPEIVRLGVVNINDSIQSSRVDVKIKNIIRHPKYRPPTTYFDIALIELKRPVHFTKYIHPACLNSKSLDDVKNKTITVTGWGQTEEGKVSKNLLYATLEFLHCSEILLNRNWWGPLNQHFCAGKLDGSADTCRGDSGGPLQYKILGTKKDGSMHMIVGLTTFGRRKCAQKNSPGVYTQVSEFIEWIERHVWPDEKNLFQDYGSIFFPSL